jgi:hypothetical protein
MVDPDLRAAIAAYLLESNAEATVPMPGLDDPAAFEQLVDMIARSGMVHMFRMMHGMLGRYPTFEDMKRGGLSMG